MDVDTELFILSVQQRHEIWDIKDEDFKDKNKKQNAWISIVHKFYPEEKDPKKIAEIGE